MIARLVASNFRSLEKVTVDLHPAFTVLVGANGSGKSAMLRALDLVCGSTWPTVRSLRVPQDWTGFDDQRELLLRVRFSAPLDFKDKAGNAHGLLGFEVRCPPYKVKTKSALPGESQLRLSSVRRGWHWQACRDARIRRQAQAPSRQSLVVRVRGGVGRLLRGTHQQGDGIRAS
jgi:energy-coupling factor transporter ATP-binding protein EcfA2